MNFRDIYKRVYEIDTGKLTEECGMPAPSITNQPKPPVTMNVSMNASGPESIRDLIDLISGKEEHAEMDSDEMDAQIIRLGQEEDAQMEAEIDQALEEGPWDDFKSGAKQFGAAAGQGWDATKKMGGAVGSAFSAAKDAVFGSEEEQQARAQLEKSLADTIIKKSGDQTLAGRIYAKCQGDDLECLYSYALQKKFVTPELDAQAKKIGLKGNANMSVEEYENEPDETYQDTAYMTKDLAGGLNKQHVQYKKEYPGDNPMAAESYIPELQNLYQQIKNR